MQKRLVKRECPKTVDKTFRDGPPICLLTNGRPVGSKICPPRRDIGKKIIGVFASQSKILRQYARPGTVSPWFDSRYSDRPCEHPL